MKTPQDISPVATPPPGAARYTGTTVSHLAKLRCTGQGPRFVKVGSSVIYRFADLDAWLASRVVTSTSEADLLPNISTDARSRQTNTAPKTASRRGRPRKADAVTGGK